MFTLRFVTEINEGGKSTLILYIFYILVSIIFSSIFIYRTHRKWNYYSLFTALFIFLIGEFIIYDLFIGLLFFRTKELINYGLGGGLFRVMFSHLAAIVVMLSFVGKLYLKLETKLVYISSVIFILVQPFLAFLLITILNIFNV